MLLVVIPMGFLCCQCLSGSLSEFFAWMSLTLCRHGDAAADSFGTEGATVLRKM